jgi:hypothetical protein
MLVHHEVAIRVADFPVPDVHAVRIESKAREVVGVGVDRLLDGNPEAPVRPEGVGERCGVIDAEQRDLLLGGRPAHDAVAIDEGAGGILRLQGHAESKNKGQGAEGDLHGGE